MKKLILASVLGGMVAFAVGAAWWMALPWQGHSLKSVTDEAAVVAVIQAQAKESGIYVIPKKPKPGARVFASVKLDGGNPAGPAMYLKGLLINFSAAFLFCSVLASVSGLTYWGRVKVVVVISQIVGVLGYLPAWLWWGFSAEYTLATIVGLLLAWSAAGLIMAKIIVHPDDEPTLG